MLRLEQTSRYSGEVTIRMSGREPFLSRRLRRALFLALSLHLLAFLLVRVESVPSPFSELQAAVMAEAYPGGLVAVADGSAIPVADGVGNVPHYVLLPESSVPELPEIGFRTVEWHSQVAKGLEIAPTAFKQIESISFQPEASSFTFIAQHQPSRVRVKGPLAELELIDDGLGGLGGLHERFEPVQSYFVTYDVQVELRTGQVFTLDLAHPSGEKGVDRLARQVIRSMRFAPKDHGLVSSGTVELLVELSDALSIDALQRLQARNRS